MTRDQLGLVQEMMRKRMEGATNIPVKDLAAYWDLTAALAALVAAAWRAEPRLRQPTPKVKLTPVDYSVASDDPTTP